MAKGRAKPVKDLKGKGKKVSKLEAESVRGGRKSGEGQKDFLKVTMKEVLISG